MISSLVAMAAGASFIVSNATLNGLVAHRKPEIAKHSVHPLHSSGKPWKLI